MRANEIPTRVLVLGAVLLTALAGAARAQVVSPAVTTLAGPLALRAHIEGDREHGCSRSHESVGIEAGVELSVDAAGRASVRLLGNVMRVSGPSLGAWRAGDHDVSSVTELHDVRWTGTARLDATAAALELDLTGREGAELRYAGLVALGSVPFPAPVASAVAVHATCRKVDRDVLPATRADGEVATSMALVECSFASGLPDPLERYLDASASVVMGAGPGVRTLTNDGMWGATTSELRLTE